MNIAVVALGSRGDVEPLVALARGLSDAGHEVTVTVSRDQTAVPAQHGLAHRVIDVDVAVEAARGAGLDWQADGSRQSILGELRLIRDLASRFADALVDAVLEIPVDTDLIISGALSYDAVKAVIATRPTTRHVLALLAPLAPAPEGESNALAVLPQRTSALNTLVSALTYLSVRRTYGRPGQVARARLGLPPESLAQYYRTAYRTPTLLAVSPALVPPSKRWGPRVRQTGAWRAPLDPAWRPPASLRDFLDAGPPPVYLGFGSMMSRHPEQTTAQLLAALERSGHRGLLSAGWTGLGSADLPESVHLVGDVPHRWLLPRTSAVVHHGGAGTTAAAAHAGVPQVVVPHIGDQPYWARRMHQLGVAAAPIARHDLDAERLTGALTEVTGDRLVRERAASLGERLAREDGVAQAVDLIGGW